MRVHVSPPLKVAVAVGVGVGVLVGTTVFVRQISTPLKFVSPPLVLTSPYHWREQYKHGNTAPAEALLEQYRHTKCVSVVLRAQLEGKTYRQAAVENGYSPASFPKYMKRAARLLRDAYAA
jgi:hypothetical protein